MVGFLSIQYRLGKISEQKLQLAVEKGLLTSTQKDIIIQNGLMNNMEK